MHIRTDLKKITKFLQIEYKTMMNRDTRGQMLFNFYINNLCYPRANRRLIVSHSSWRVCMIFLESVCDFFQVSTRMIWLLNNLQMLFNFYIKN